MMKINTLQTPEPNESGNYVYGLDLGHFLEESNASNVIDAKTIGVELEINQRLHKIVSWELEDGCWLVECKLLEETHGKEN